MLRGFQGTTGRETSGGEQRKSRWERVRPSAWLTCAMVVVVRTGGPSEPQRSGCKMDAPDLGQGCFALVRADDKRLVAAVRQQIRGASRAKLAAVDRLLTAVQGDTTHGEGARCGVGLWRRDTQAAAR